MGIKEGTTGHTYIEKHMESELSVFLTCHLAQGRILYSLDIVALTLGSYNYVYLKLYY